MIPSRRALLLFGAASSLFVFAFVTPGLAWAGFALDGVLLGLLVVDGLRARRLPVRVHAELPGILHQAEPEQGALVVENRGAQEVQVHVRQVLGEALEPDIHDSEGSVAPRSRGRWTFRVLPARRGDRWIPAPALRVLGPWHLAWSSGAAGKRTRVRIHPRMRFRGVEGLQIRLATERRQGAVPLQVRGVSSEMYALREYLPGDDYRHVHWKASARFGRPVTREHTWEQHRNVVILLDCGRPMAARALGPCNRLDHALAALLALLRVVVAQQDTATLVLFSREIRRVVRVDRRTVSFRPVFEALYAEEVDLEEPDYVGAALWCARRVARRSLVLLCTSVLDLATAEALGSALRHLALRHRGLLVNLEDPALLAHATGSPETVKDAYAKVSALALQTANHELESRLRARGVDVLSTPPAGLVTGLLRRYLYLKSRGEGSSRLPRSMR